MTRRACRVAAVVVASAAIVATARAAEAVPIRGSRAIDAAPRTSAWTEWWRLHGIQPRTGRYFTIEVQTRGVPELRMSLLDPVPFTGASGADGLVERGAGTLLDVASLTRTADGWRMIVDHRRGKAQLTVTGRPGVTAGPWRLGRQPVADTNPTRWERGSMTWAALVPAGRVDGWVSWDDVRYDVDGWHAYLDHTWGRFRNTDSAWDHWDRAVWHRGRGESWLLQGLEPRPGRPVLAPRPDDRRWRGVLVHVTPRGITSCRPTIRRSGWDYVPDGATNPSTVAATCKGRTVTFRRWNAAFRQHMLADRSGFIEHRIDFWRH